MKLALHRSITFWSGILVMGFIGWAWWVSLSRAACVTRGATFVSSAKGGVTVESRELGPGQSVRGWSVGYNEPHLAKFPVNLLPAPQWIRGKGQAQIRSLDGFNKHMEEVDNAPTHREHLDLYFKHARPGSWLLFVPYWMILLAVAVPWLALLLSRARRRMRPPVTREPSGGPNT